MVKPALRAFVLMLIAIVPATTTAQGRAADPAALATAAVKALEERRFDDALNAYTAAIKVVPHEPNLWFGAGIAAYELGRHDEAAERLGRALKLNPSLTHASILLGYLQYRAGDANGAIATYEAALARAPGERALLDRLEQWRKESAVSGRFYEFRGARFRVMFRGPSDEALARRAVEILDRAYWRVGGALTTYPPDAVTVVLYTEQQFRDVTDGPAWAGGLYDGQIRVAARDALRQPANLERVLVHEFVHAVVHMLGGPGVPAWIHEGLASVFEPDGLERATRVLAGRAAKPQLQDLHDGFSRLSSEDAGLAYAQSTVAVRRMLDLRGAPAVVALLRDVAAGAEFGPAFHQRLAITYEDFQRRVNR